MFVKYHLLDFSQAHSMIFFDPVFSYKRVHFLEGGSIYKEKQLVWRVLDYFQKELKYF